MAENDLAGLGEALTITEHRAAMLKRMTNVLVVNHSLTIERESVSVRDFHEMIAYLEAAGMPQEATLAVEAREGRFRVYATWSTEPTEGREEK